MNNNIAMINSLTAFVGENPDQERIASGLIGSIERDTPVRFRFEGRYIIVVDEGEKEFYHRANIGLCAW